MKRELIILTAVLFCIFLSTTIVGQRKKGNAPVPSGIRTNPKTIAVDSGNVKIWYAFCALDLKNTETYDDFQILEIGERYSKYYSWFRYNSILLVADYMKKNPQSGVLPRILGPYGKDINWSEYYYSEYYKDNQEKTFTEYTRMPLKFKFNTYYTESIPTQEWTICDETKIIAGYDCQKAICHFRGRNYIAWFSIDIPYNNGPWKFGGLPGLILKATDTENLFDFECVKIETTNNTYPITKYNGYRNYKELDRKKHLKLQRDLNENWYKMIGWTSPKGRVEYDALELE